MLIYDISPAIVILEQVTPNKGEIIELCIKPLIASIVIIPNIMEKNKNVIKKKVFNVFIISLI
jgi:hypothetical protein